MAQQMLILLNQLAHNLIRWTQNWMTKAIERAEAMTPSLANWWTSSGNSIAEDVRLATATLNSFGMKRFVCQVLCLSGKVVMKKGKVLRVKLNPLYPMVKRIRTAFVALLKSYEITVSLHENWVITIHT